MDCSPFKLSILQGTCGKTPQYEQPLGAEFSLCPKSTVNSLTRGKNGFFFPLANTSQNTPSLYLPTSSCHVCPLNTLANQSKYLPFYGNKTNGFLVLTDTPTIKDPLQNVCFVNQNYGKYHTQSMLSSQ